MRKLSKSRLLAAAIGATLATAAANQAMASFQYVSYFDDGTAHTNLNDSGSLITAGNTTTLHMATPGVVTIDVYARIVETDSNLDNDGISTDTMSMVSSKGATGSAITTGGIVNAYQPDATFVPAQSTIGSAFQFDATDNVADWGSKDVTTPTTGWFRYLSANANAMGYRVGTPRNKKAAAADIPAGKTAGSYVPDTVNIIDPHTYEILIGAFDVNVAALGPKDTQTTFTPLSGNFAGTGTSSSYALAYFQDDNGLITAAGGATVKNVQLAPLGVTIISDAVASNPLPIVLTPAATSPNASSATFGGSTSFNVPVGNFKDTNGPLVQVKAADGTVTPGSLGTKLTILNGNATAAHTIVVKSRVRAGDEQFSSHAATGGSFGLISDVFDITGVGATNPTDVFVLGMTYDPSNLGSLAINMTEHNQILNKMIFVGDFNTTTGQWENAVKANVGNLGSFKGDVAYDGTDLTVGDWGVDSSTHTAWAILNHNTAFAVVPEPATFGLLGLAGLGLLARRRARKA